jgi:hypothetical protein
VKAHLRLQQWWEETRAGIKTETIPEQYIAELENRYSLILPDDFRDYLRFSSPVGETWDARMGTWREFEQIKNIPDEYQYELAPAIASQAHKYLFFVDHCIWCWAWAISCADDKSRGCVAFIGGAPYDKIVASSFSDFVGKYISDWKSVALGGP